MEQPKGKKRKSVVSQIILNVVSVIFAVVISNFLGTSIPAWIYWIIALVICIIVVGVFYLLSFFIADCLEMNKVGGTDIKVCKYTNHICCGDITFNNIKSHYGIEPDDDLKRRLKEQYSLFFQKEVLENEEKNFAFKKGKEVWIVSSSLSTEVSEGATALVGENLNNAIKYNEFYSSTDTQGRENKIAEENIKQMKSRYNNNANLSFIPYDRAKDGVSSYLFDIFGIVIYIYENQIMSAYFSIRHSLRDQPIYYKMPWCMGERYYDILTNIQNKAKPKKSLRKA